MADKESRISNQVKRKRGPYKERERKVWVDLDTIGNYGFNDEGLDHVKTSVDDEVSECGSSKQVDQIHEEAVNEGGLADETGDSSSSVEASVGEKEVNESCTLETHTEDNLPQQLHNYLLLSAESECEQADTAIDDDFNPEDNSSDEDIWLSDSGDESSDDFNLDDVIYDNSAEEEVSGSLEDEPLYPGARVTFGAFILLLAMFCIKNHIVGDGVQQLLNIITLILPHGHILPTSLHSYKNFFRKLKNPLKKHFYCNFCLSYIEDEQRTTCPNLTCQKQFILKDENYFLEMPVIDQIRNLFAQDGFYESLGHRFRRQVNDGSYEDIYDGSLYKSYCADNGPLAKQENISFVGNTDGAPVFKSSNISIWPVFLVVNELPYRIRMQKENTIHAALWFGKKKPSMSTFLKPFLESMTYLYNGVTCTIPRIGQKVCKCFLICITADLPARSMLCNCNQYNGAYSCWKCLQKGKTAKVGKGHAHIFPFDPANPKGPERTVESYVQNATSVVEAKLSGRKCVENGIKGPSWLLLVPKFHIIQGVAIDYMHGVLLGVQKLPLRLWFSPEFSKVLKRNIQLSQVFWYCG